MNLRVGHNTALDIVTIKKHIDDAISRIEEEILAVNRKVSGTIVFFSLISNLGTIS